MNGDLPFNATFMRTEGEIRLRNCFTNRRPIFPGIRSAAGQVFPLREVFL